MPIDQAITKLADKVRDLKPLIDSEVGTKTAFITPFINDVLGYDVSDPREVVPEYTAGTGERVDYAIKSGADIRILLLCTKINEPLTREKTAELARCFNASNANFGILANGESYEIYTRRSDSQLMDGRPVLNLNLSALDFSTFPNVEKLTKFQFDPRFHGSANMDRKYIDKIKEILVQQFNYPDPSWVNFLASKVVTTEIGGTTPANFTELVRTATTEFLQERVSTKPAPPAPAAAIVPDLPPQSALLENWTNPVDLNSPEDMPWPLPEHEVRPDEVFFSTTDARGVIEEANDVFIRLSHFTRDELIGAPHNIIRHSGMPGAVFRTMWDALHKGIPFAGYVRNRAKDGSSYDVYATVTRLENGGYLSVRITPSISENWALAQGIYDELSELETELADAGFNRRTAAERGSQRLTEMLNELGIADYEHLQWMQLPDEISAREAYSVGIPERPYAFGHLNELLTVTRETFNELDSWMREQEDILQLARSLTTTGEQLRQEIQATVGVATKMDELDVSGPEREVLLIPLKIWMNMHSLASQYLEELVDLLPQLSDAGAKTRFHIALARLHTTMVGTFATELIDGKPDAEKSAPAIHLLCSALRQTLHEMDDQALTYQRVKSRVSARIRSVKSIMEIPRTLIVDWTEDVRYRSFTPATSALVDTVSSSISGASTAIAELDSLVARLESGSVHDTSTLRSLVEHIDAEAHAYQTSL